MVGFALGGGQVVAGIRGILLDKTKEGKVFKRGIMHDHQPTGGPASGRWAEVVSLFNLHWIPMNGQEAAIQDIVATFKYTHFRDITPAELMDVVANPLIPPGWLGDKSYGAFTDKPIALDHLNWFLKNGNGDPYKENVFLKAMLLTDNGVIRAVADDMQTQTKKNGLIEHSFKLEQSNYDNVDYQFAFGGIDWFSYCADFAEGTLDAWFIDRYEWHPYYQKGMYPAADGKEHVDDEEARPTNILHAACVELKADKARDFWMIGEATVPLDSFLKPPPRGAGASEMGKSDALGGTVF
jgi:hypothetical protein